MYLEDDELPARGHSRKDKKRWCKGRVGRPHEPVISSDPKYGSACKIWNYGVINKGKIEPHSRYMCYHVIQCKNCGKILKWALTEGECPDSGRN
jgi:hypothetical protein